MPETTSSRRPWITTLAGGLTTLATLVTGIAALVGIGRTFLVGPRIVSFEASPDSLRPGETSVLSWEIEEADRVRIAPDIGEVPLEGRRTLRPTRSTEYLLTAEKGLQQKQVRLKVTIEPVAPAAEAPPLPAEPPMPLKASEAPETRRWTGVGRVSAGLPLESAPTATVTLAPEGSNSVRITVEIDNGTRFEEIAPDTGEWSAEQAIAGGSTSYRLRYSDDGANLEVRHRYDTDQLDRTLQFDLKRE